MKTFLSKLTRGGDLPDHLTNYQGKKCPVNTQDPWVTLSSEHGRDYYQRGSIVYPIGDEGEQPGNHHTPEYITLSTLNTTKANFCGFRRGVGAVSLINLIQQTGDKVGITLYDENRQKIIREVGNNREKIEEMLDEFIKQKVPEAVREQESLSTISNPEATEYESGIICDSLDDVGKMLRAYEQGVAPKSNVTQQKQLEDVGNPYGGEAVALTMFANAVRDNGSQFVEDMISQIEANGGNWNYSYDYDGQGRFFKTTVTVKPRNDKFVLEISDNYVGNELEIQLAEAMETERALIRMGSQYNLSTIGDSNWVGVDLEEILRDVLPAEQITKLAKISGGDIKEEYGHPHVVEIDNAPVNLSINLGQDNNYDSKIVRVGNRLFFESKEKGSEGKYGREHGDTYFSFSVKPGNDQPIVDPQQKDRLSLVQEKLDKAIQEKLSA